VEMDMFGGLTKTSSRIAIAAALGMTLGGFAMSASPAKAADLGGDCCADLEERVAELEATTVRKGNKKVSVTLSGWVVKLGSWWDDGSEENFYIGDKDTTLSSHFQISGSAQISPGWSAGYTIAVETPGTSCSAGFVENQFDDNACLFGDINTLLSYMWIKSDRWGTVNWGELSQATDNVALLPDLSGTIIESNAVFFEGPGFFLVVMLAETFVELAGETADGGLVADVGGAQPAAGEPAEVAAEAQQRHGAAHARRLHRRGDAAGGGAVHADVAGDALRVGGDQGVPVAQAGIGREGGHGRLQCPDHAPTSPAGHGRRGRACTI